MYSPYYQITVEAERTPGAVVVSGHTVTHARPDRLPAWRVLSGAR